MPLESEVQKVVRMDRQSEPKSMAEHAEALCEAIRQQLDSDISGLSDKAEAIESSILEKGEEQAAQIRAKILAEAQERVRQYDEETAAEISQKSRLAWLREREKLLDEVTDKLTARFPQEVKSAEYAAKLPEWVLEALAQLQSEAAVISLDALSNQLLSDARLSELGKAAGVELKRGEILREEHGLVVTSVDGRRSFANTFEARFERQRPQLRILAARFLLGE